MVGQLSRHAKQQASTMGASSCVTFRVKVTSCLDQMLPSRLFGVPETSWAVDRGSEVEATGREFAKRSHY
jgi:hypothetical protein